jgi:O-acetyl-ADP-ribose deacetylase (regulator of RNase III)
LQASSWTNKSVQLFAKGADPVVHVGEGAQRIVTQALDQGWPGPPFDPFDLAERLGLAVQPNDSVPDARTVARGSGRLLIAFNPNRPRGRLRYSLAHEIAHTLFPDCAESVRNRGTTPPGRDERQLEALCNIAATEFLMPLGSLPALDDASLSIDSLLELRKRFDVSVEAMLIRAVHVSDVQCAAVCWSRIETGSHEGEYRVDYVIPGRAGRWSLPSSVMLPRPAIPEQCVAIGHTAKGKQRWPGVEGLIRLECVGIPPYPGCRFPRVAGLAFPSGRTGMEPAITYLKGDATDPHVPGPKMIAHVVNDATSNWGGGGFAKALRRAFPSVQEDFKSACQGDRDLLKLGRTRVFDLADDVSVASMVAQRGYGPSARPRIRYEALATCLRAVVEAARERFASIHMPSLGCGEAGGSWDIVRDLLLSATGTFRVPLFVYEIPGVERATIQGQLSIEYTRPK